MRYLLLALLAGLAAPKRPGREPYVAWQQSFMVLPQYESARWERRFRVRNPLPRPVWVYVECESRLTSNPIEVRARRAAEFVLPDIPPDEGCSINHWRVKVPGHDPPQWRP